MFPADAGRDNGEEKSQPPYVEPTPDRPTPHHGLRAPRLMHHPVYRCSLRFLRLVRYVDY